jgi:hypothetical protein
MRTIHSPGRPTPVADMGGSESRGRQGAPRHVDNLRRRASRLPQRADRLVSRAETRVAQGCVYPSSVDVLLEVIAAIGKRKVVEVRVRRDPLTEMGVETVLYLPFDQITLSFNSFRGYRVPRHSIPPLTSVVDADLSIA